MDQDIINEYIGRIISVIVLVREEDGPDHLNLGFDDGSSLILTDEGQQCCEYRYMTCDDDLSYFVGSQFRGVRVADGPLSRENLPSGDYQEQQFLIIQVDIGGFTVATHNEHNGYYGGFNLQVAKGRSLDWYLSRDDNNS